MTDDEAVIPEGVTEEKSGFLEGGVTICDTVWQQVLTISKELTVYNRSIMVDTNYLTLINKKDYDEMLLDPAYETKVQTPFKKQMARLFRDFMQRKIDLCFSNFIMREFLGRAPRRKELLEIYKRDIIVVSPKEHLESSFLDLAAAIDACIIEDGGEGDVKDTYSYILAAIAKIRIFVTEDSDIKRVYEYLSGIRAGGFDNVPREIRKIKEMYKLLNDGSEPNFPIDELLGALFMREYGDLPIPVSVDRLHNSLPQVLDKFDPLIWIYRSLQEIEMLSKHLQALKEFPEDWDGDIITRAKERIHEVATSIGFQPAQAFDECNLRTKLIEEDEKWEQHEDDVDLANNANLQLDKLHERLYALEYPADNEYENMEEQFYAEEDPKEFNVKCNECGYEFTLDADYNGIVSSYEREMGSEHCHEWSGESECPNCDNKVSVLHEIWEYPEWSFNSEDTNFEGCEQVLKKKEEELPLKTLDDFISPS